MWEDPIVAEVRKVREDDAAQFNFDLQALCRALKEREQRDPRPEVSFPPKPARLVRKRSQRLSWPKARHLTRAKANSPMPEPLLVRDVMRIGVPTCKLEDTIAHVAALLIDGGHTAVVVLDDEADTRGWINERILASAYGRAAATDEDASGFAAQDVMDENVPECPSDIPLGAAVSIMADLGVDHLFFLHHAGRTHLARIGIELARRGEGAGRAGISQEPGDARRAPTPMDLFRQRYGLAKTR